MANMFSKFEPKKQQDTAIRLDENQRGASSAAGGKTGGQNMFSKFEPKQQQPAAVRLPESVLSRQGRTQNDPAHRETLREGNPLYNDDISGNAYKTYRSDRDIDIERTSTERRMQEANARLSAYAAKMVKQGAASMDDPVYRQLLSEKQEAAARIDELAAEKKAARNQRAAEAYKTAAAQVKADQSAYFPKDSAEFDRLIAEAEEQRDQSLAETERWKAANGEKLAALKAEYEELRKKGYDIPARLGASQISEYRRYQELGREISQLEQALGGLESTAGATENRLYYINGAKTFSALTEDERQTALDFVALRESGFAPSAVPNYHDSYTDFDGAKKEVTAEQLKSVPAAYAALRESLLERGVSSEDVERMQKTMQALYNARTRASENAGTAEYAAAHPVLSSIGSVLTNLAGGFSSGADLLIQSAENASKPGGYKAPLDFNTRNQTASAFTDTARGTVSQKISDGNGALGQIGAFVYQTGMSGADSLLASFLGNAGGASSLGLSAAYSAAKDAHERGAADAQAMWTGVFAGVFETLFERVSIGNLNALKETPVATVKDVFLNIAKSMGVNASEEAATEAADILSDYLINGDLSAYGESCSARIAAGETEAEARTNALLDMLKQIGLAGAGGALMGVGFAGGAGVYNYARGNRGNNAAGSLFTGENNRLDEESYSALMTKGLQSKNAEIRDYAMRLGEKRDGVSQKEAGLLFRMLLSENMESNVDPDENGLMRTEDAASPEIPAQGADESAVQSFDGVDAPSTSMQFMAAENYTPERRKTIREYLQAANREFSAFVERVKRGEKTRPWFNLGGVNERAAADVQRLTGVDVRGYANSITPNDVRHIVRRHGENGVADHSMRDVNDLARIEYVLQNYDSVELVDEKALDVRNSDNTPSDMIKFSKKIDGTYYVVEAVPDSNAKRMRVKSAYISAKGESHAAANAEALNTTPEAHLPYSADTYNISQAEGESQEDGENLQLRAEEMRARGMREVERFASEIGGAGRKAFIGMYSPEMNAAEYIQGMNDYYTAGKRGVAFSDVQSRYSANLSQPAREAAYFAGQVDAKAALGTVTYKSGVKVSENLAKTFAKAAQDLHVHIIYGGKAPVVNGVKDRAYISRNGDLRIYEDIEVQLSDGRILKGDDAAIMVILIHEMTHRMQRLAPKEYAAFRDFVLARKSGAIDGYMKTGLSRDAAIDEIASDYAMTTLFTDQNTINEITKKHSKLAEVIRDILEWIKAKLGFRSSELERAIRLWNNAYNAAVRSAKTGDAVQNGNVGVDVQYSRKIGYFPKNEVSADGIQQYFDIRNINDKYEVINKVSQKLKETYLSTETQKKPVKNIDTGIEIEIWKGGINETFGNNAYYQNISAAEKLNKLAVMPKLANLIKYGEVRAEDAKNYHNLNSKVIYSYLIAPVTIDGVEYNVKMDIRRSPHGENRFYIHSLEIKKDDAHLARSAERLKDGTSSNSRITQKNATVNSNSMQKSKNNTSEDTHSVDGTEEILFESEADKARHVADSFDLSGVENFKESGYMERMSGIAASISKAYRVNKDSRLKLAKALEKGIQNMRMAAKSDDVKLKQTAAESFLKAAKIILPDADTQAQVEIANALSKSIWAEMTTDRRADTIRSIRDEAINSARADVRAARLAEFGEKYGTIKPGEKPSRTVALPKRTSPERSVSQTVRTVMEAAATPDEMIPTIEQMVAGGEFSYEAVTDKEAITAAENKITENGFDSAVREWFKSVSSGKVSKNNAALGWAIYNHAANSGDTELAVDVLCEMVNHQRNAAQALQASRILKKMSPSAQLYAAQRTVQNLQEELTERYGDQAPNLKIDTVLADKVIHGETAEEREQALQSLYRDIGRQLPSTVLDKWNAWRYLAMLGNVRTHIRNISGNAVFAPVVAVKDIVATSIETVCGFASRGEMKRTKAFVWLSKADRALLAAAWADYEMVADAALGQTKYSESQYANKYIEEGRRIFTIRPLEAARRGNSKLLDMEDSWFSKPHYANAMAQYCKANGITAEQIQSGAGLDQARAYAIKEAQKATYRDTNAFSELFSKVGKLDESGQFKTAKRIWNRGVEGVLPFRKTPANILARGIEYSPVGFVSGVADLFRIKNGKATAAEAIDKIASGLTGSGLMALGAYLVSQGILRGIGEDDDKEKAFQELAGHQSYALEIGNISVTLDWLAPEALPFFVGANIMEEFMKDGEMNINKVVSAFARISDPMLSMSCLQGLNDLIESVSYSSASGIASMAASAATSYIMQGIPTLFGQIERTTESERMTTYTDKNNKFLTTDMQYAIGKATQKLPGDFSQIPYIDAWGRTESNGSVGERAFNNFINPAYVSTVQESAMEKELLRLYKATGEPVLPSRADKYIYIDQEQVYLNAEEYQTYAVKKGQTAYRLLTEITASRAYADMDDSLKAEAVSYAYSYANAIAKRDTTADFETPYEVTGWIEKCETGTENGVRVAEFILAKAAISNIDGGYTDQNTGKTIENSESLRKMEAIYAIPGLNEDQRTYLFEAFGVGKKVIHYNKACVSEHLQKMRNDAGIE